MTDPIYEIVDWRKNFETYESRRLKALNWVRIPNKFDGRSFKRLGRHPRASCIFGCWLLMVEVASRMPTRGLLVDDSGQALGPDELEDYTGFPADDFREAIAYLESPKCGWIASRACKGGGAESADPPPADLDVFPQIGSKSAGETRKSAGEVAKSAGAPDRSAGKSRNLHDRQTDRQNTRAPARGQGGYPPATPGHGVAPPGPPSGDGPSGPAGDVAMHAPPDLKRANRATWHDIAKQHGPEVANRAHDATKARHGAIYLSSQLTATYQAAYRAEALDLPAAEWPTPGAKPPQQPDDGMPPSSGEILFAPEINEPDEFDLMFPPDPGPIPPKDAT